MKTYNNDFYIVSSDSGDLTRHELRNDAEELVKHLRSKGLTANMRKNGMVNFIPVSDILVSEQRPARARHVDILT